jgi:hypothetical protein
MSDDPINDGTQVKHRQARRVVGLLALVVSVAVVPQPQPTAGANETF